MHKLVRIVNNDSKKALDIACGSAQLICKIAKEFENINFTAIDFSDEMLKIAEESKKEYGLNNINFKLCNMLKLKKSFGSEKFDLITFNFAMHHTDNSEEVIQIINSALDLLSDDGVLFIFDIERIKTKALAEEFSRAYSLKYGKEHYEDTYNSYLAAYTFNEFEDILKKTNWKNYEHIHPFLGNFTQLACTKVKNKKINRKPNLESYRLRRNYNFIKFTFKNI